MKWSDLKNTIAKVAPILGTVIGGPHGLAVGSLVSRALGVDNTPEAVAEEIKRNPEALIKLKQLESDERMHFQDLALKTLDVELKDTQSAREHHKHSKVPDYLVFVLTILTSSALILLIFFEIPESNKSIIYLMVGSIMSAWFASIQYWCGTTRSSAQKTISAALK